MNNVRLGRNPLLDDDILLGYKSQRNIKFKRAFIGDNARIRSNTVIYSNTVIGNGLETGHNVVIREENKIGDNFSIWSNSCVDYGCMIGRNVRVHNNVYICQFSKIEDDCFIGPGAMLANDPHPVCTKCMKGPTLKKGARIGINATILPGVVIGEYSLVGAGSVVTRNVPPYTVVYGNPAKIACLIYEIKCQKSKVNYPYKKGKRIKNK